MRQRLLQYSSWHAVYDGQVYAVWHAAVRHNNVPDWHSM
jgi:hypothetical protein